MPASEISSFSKRITILIGLSVVGAMACGLAISFYRNMLFEDTLNTLSERNRKLRLTIDKGIETLAYYRSRQYRDKYAKENLGKLSVDEKVLIITPEEMIFQVDTTPVTALSFKEEKEASYRLYLQKIPTIEHWRMYVFEPEKLEELQQSF